MDRRKFINSKFISIVFLIGFVFASLPTTAASADPGSPIYMTPTLTTTFDGVAPLPTTIDNSTSNGLVANNDSVGQDFDFTVNTSDGQSHNLSYVILTATLSPDAGSAQWSEASLPTSCIGQFASAKKVSTDGLQVKCRINGPFVIGSVNKISATWSPTSITPHNTDVDVSFTLSGVMTADALYPVPINPDDVTSTTETTTAVSEVSSLETRKWAGPYTINRNNGTGAPESVTFSWGVTFGLVNPLATSVKGANSSTLGSISLNDDFSEMGMLWQNATLGSCGIGTASDTYPIPIGVGTSHITTGNRSNVKNAGTFSCSQPGGAGTNIEIDNTGVDFNATWFPIGYVNTTPTAYYGMNHPTIANEVWDSPIGTNNHAVVSAGYITTTIPWTDIIAFDNSGQDPIASLNTVRVCNTVSDLEVVGDDPTYVDPTADNSACVDLGIGTIQSVAKRFAMGSVEDTKVNEYINAQPSSYGSVSPNTDNVVVPGEKLFSNLTFHNTGTSINAITSPQMCDVIDNNNLRIVANDFYSDLGTYNNFSANGYTNHSFYSSKLSTITSVSGFPSETVPTESDIIVEFANAPPMTSSSSLRTFDCDSIDPGDWKTDPNNVTGGINNANVTRVRLADGKNLIPGRRIEVSIPMQVLPTKNYGDIVQNVMRSRSGTTTSQQSANAWSNLTSTCEVYNWAATNTATNNCDRAYVTAATGHLELTDNVDSSLAGTQHRQTEGIRSVQAGSSWTFDVRASMGYNADVSVDNVNAYVVLPEGVNYQSSTLAPDNIIGECDASINFACITSPGLRNNTGSTTLVWELGDFEFDFPNGQDPGTIYHPEGFFGYWKVTADTDLAFTSGIKRQTRGWMTADTGLATQSVNWPSVETTWSVYYDNDSNGRYDDDWITFTQTAQFIISKWTPDFLIPIEGSGRYDVTYTNGSSTSRTFDFIDILPFNGDARVPPSSFTGSISLGGIDLSRAAGISQIYVTSTNPATLNPDPASNVSVGTGIWTCTYAEIGTPGCPTNDQVTALRFVTSALASSARQTVRITIDTTNNTGADLYSNNAMGRASGLAGEIHTEDVYFRTQFLRVGNRVFIDLNDNGLFDGSDTPVAGVEMQLRSSFDDSIIDTTTTDTDGFYLLTTGNEGEYYIRIAPSEFGSSGALRGYRAQKDGSVNVGNENDEAADHNARMYSSTNIRTADFDLTNFGEPTGESGDSGLWDSSSNLTLDFALELPAFIGNYVWLDLDDDGIQDSGEPGVSGVDISALYYGDDDALGGGDDETFTTTTDSSGQWQIDGPAGTYAVSYGLPDGYSAARIDEGSDDAVDSDADGVVGSVVVDSSNLDFDFGIIGDSTLGDTIFYDVDGDGSQEVEDVGLDNVNVTLVWYGFDDTFGGGDDLVLTDTTDQEGQYLFERLPPGNFRVTVDVESLPSNLRRQSYDPDDDMDSVSHPVLGAFFSSDMTHDFGYTVAIPSSPPSTSNVAGNGATGTLPTTGSGVSWITTSILMLSAGIVLRIMSRRSTNNNVT